LVDRKESGLADLKLGLICIFFLLLTRSARLGVDSCICGIYIKKKLVRLVYRLLNVTEVCTGRHFLLNIAAEIWAKF
jgi:hypothetical protein